MGEKFFPNFKKMIKNVNVFVILSKKPLFKIKMPVFKIKNFFDLKKNKKDGHVDSAKEKTIFG